MRIDRRLAFALFGAWLAAAAGAADLEIDPDRTRISFALDSTLHRVHGSARLEQGWIRFDPEGGSADGRIVVDATSLDTDNGLRDGQMHAKVLESERFPRIELLPTEVLLEGREEESANIVLVGTLRIHGGEWPIRVPARVETRGDDLHIAGSFVVPYVDWGMRDMSNFLLSVDPEVSIEFETLARVEPALATASAPSAGLGR